MSALLLTGSHSVLRETQALARLASFCAGLVREGRVSVCLAMLPTERTERDALLAFLQSLRYAGVRDTAVLIRTPELSLPVLLECNDAGIGDVVILQGIEDATPGIEEMVAFRRSRPGALRYRVWLNPDAEGVLQSRVRAWEYACPNPESVEIAPFTFKVEPAPPSAPAEEETFFGCDWLSSVITINSALTLTPCPAHIAESSISVAGTSARRLTEWQEKPEHVTAGPVCRGCHRLVRFAIPEWMRGVPEEPAPTITIRSNAGYHGEISSALTELLPHAQAAAVAALIERVARSAQAFTRAPGEQP